MEQPVVPSVIEVKGYGKGQQVIGDIRNVSNPPHPDGNQKGHDRDADVQKMKDGGSVILVTVNNLIRMKHSRNKPHEQNYPGPEITIVVGTIAGDL